MFQSATIASYTAQSIAPFTAQTIETWRRPTIAIGSAYAAKHSSLGTRTSLQLEWMGRINDAVMASVRY